MRTFLLAKLTQRRNSNKICKNAFLKAAELCPCTTKGTDNLSGEKVFLDC